jgi:hypothetical protein
MYVLEYFSFVNSLLSMLTVSSEFFALLVKSELAQLYMASNGGTHTRPSPFSGMWSSAARVKAPIKKSTSWVSIQWTLVRRSIVVVPIHCTFMICK